MPLTYSAFPLAWGTYPSVLFLPYVYFDFIWIRAQWFFIQFVPRVTCKALCFQYKNIQKFPSPKDSDLIDQGWNPDINFFKFLWWDSNHEDWEPLVSRNLPTSSRIQWVINRVHKCVIYFLIRYKNIDPDFTSGEEMSLDLSATQKYSVKRTVHRGP